MNRNIGKTDKILRIVLGVVIIALGVMSGSLWGAVGLIPIVTALIGWCPLYTVCKLKTCNDNECSN